MHRHILAGGHGHGPGHKPCDSGNQDGVAISVRRRDTENKAGGRQKPVIRAQHCSAEPSALSSPVPFLETKVNFSSRHNTGLR